jgi:hypothetical protein
VKKSTVQQNYEALCFTTLRFLDAYLKGDREKQKMLFSGNEQEALPESFQVTQMLSLRK